MRSQHRIRETLTAWALCLAVTTAASGQQEGTDRPTKNEFALRPAASEIHVDAELDEPAWDEATVVPITHEWFPGDNLEPPVETECLVTFDEDHLYIAFRAYDPAPEQIRAYYADRDVAFDNDTVGFLIDTYLDRRSAFEFRVNPLGVQMDATVSDVGAEQDEDVAWGRESFDGAQDWSWDAIWDSAGKINGDGYVVEVAVPLKQLRFRSSPDVQTWGFLATRHYPRSVAHELRSTYNDRNRQCQVCQYDTLTGFRRLDAGYNLEITPTLTVDRTDARPAPGSPLEGGDEDAEAGVSVRWGVTPDLFLNATVNPDFSQVEADAAQLDVNERFALFFPEKRPFFLEGADYFGTPIFAYFTRSVADPTFGGKLTGKLGRHAFGTTFAQDEINNLIFPSAESSRSTSLDDDVLSGALRYRRDIGSTSSLGVLYTGREADDYFNHVVGLDGNFQVTDSDSIDFQYLTSTTRYPGDVASDFGQPAGSFDGDMWQLTYTHETNNWEWLAILDSSDRGFRADSGFIPRVGTRSFAGAVVRSFWGPPDSWYSRFAVQVDYSKVEVQGGRKLDSGENLTLIYDGPLESRVQLAFRQNRESFLGNEFDNPRADLYVALRPHPRLDFEILIRSGNVIDFSNVRQADFEFLQPGLKLNLGRRFEGRLDHTYQKFSRDGAGYLTANLTQSRLIFHINRRTFVRAILQYRNVDRDLDFFINPNLQEKEESFFSQFLFSYKLNARSVFLVGYSDNYFGNQALGLTQTDRTFYMKIGYSWLR